MHLAREPATVDDIEKATEIVRDMLFRFGMSQRAPDVSLMSDPGLRYLGERFETGAHSDELMEALDAEMASTIADCYSQARAALVSHRRQLDLLATTLLEQEELDRDSIARLLGEPQATAPWRTHS